MLGFISPLLSEHYTGFSLTKEKQQALKMRAKLNQVLKVEQCGSKANQRPCHWKGGCQSCRVKSLSFKIQSDPIYQHKNGLVVAHAAFQDCPELYVVPILPLDNTESGSRLSGFTLSSPSGDLGATDLKALDFYVLQRKVNKLQNNCKGKQRERCRGYGHDKKGKTQPPRRHWQECGQQQQGRGCAPVAGTSLPALSGSVADKMEGYGRAPVFEPRSFIFTELTPSAGTAAPAGASGAGSAARGEQPG
nr:uncharacterized protein LOC125184099 [Anser cygnoides]